MSIWNQVLQATHSALIDELNERFPDEKLELGLPKRFDRYEALPGHTHLGWTAIISLDSSDPGKGFSGLALGALQSEKEIASLAAALISRFDREFKLRGISARVDPMHLRSPELRMLIWLPICIRRPTQTLVFDLALGV